MIIVQYKESDDVLDVHDRADKSEYGITTSEIRSVEEQKLIPIIVVDVQGALELNKKSFEGNYLFIYPPSFAELRRRLGHRIETEQEFRTRIAEAIKEIEKANNSVLFTNRLVNEDLEIAIDQFNTLIRALYFQEIQASKFKEIEAKAAAPSTEAK